MGFAAAADPAQDRRDSLGVGEGEGSPVLRSLAGLKRRPMPWRIMSRTATARLLPMSR